MHISTPGAKKYVRQLHVDALTYEDTPAGRARTLAFVNARSDWGLHARVSNGQLLVRDDIDGNETGLIDGDVIAIEGGSLAIWDAEEFACEFDEVETPEVETTERWQYDGNGADLGLLNRLNEFYGRTHAAYVSAAGLVIESSPAHIICVVPKDHYLYFTPDFPEARSE